MQNTGPAYVEEHDSWHRRQGVSPRGGFTFLSPEFCIDLWQRPVQNFRKCWQECLGFLHVRNHEVEEMKALPWTYQKQNMWNQRGAQSPGATFMGVFLFWVFCSPPFLSRAFSASALTAHCASFWRPLLFLCRLSKAQARHFTGQHAEGTNCPSEPKSRHITVELSHTKARNKTRTHYRKVFFGTI